MRSKDIENWALEIIERVLSHQPVEDSLIELKSEWPKDSHKAARQIAGHANAARGEPILWLIGVDEKKAMVKGANYEEISNWKQSIDSKFDGIAPNLTHINVPYEGKTVVALLWETDRRPFLVKNSEGGPISLEVPWRDAGSTRTATRTDLLRLLYPVSKAPSFELIKGSFTISSVEFDDYGQRLCRGGLALDVYVLPGGNERVVIPYHKCEVNVKLVFSDFPFMLDRLWFHSSQANLPFGGPEASPAIHCTRTEVIIDGPGMVTIATDNPSESPEDRNIMNEDIDLTIKMPPIGADVPVSITARLKRAQAPKGSIGHWIL